MDLLERLLGHDQATTTAILDACAVAPDAQLDEPFDIGQRTLRGILAHMIRNLEIWTDLMLGRTPRIEPADTSLAALAQRHASAYAEFAAMAKAVQAADRLDVTFLDVLDRPPVAKPLGGGIAHVITHNMHHRAAVFHVARRLGLTGFPAGDLLEWELKVANRSSEVIPAEGRLEK